MAYKNKGLKNDIRRIRKYETKFYTGNTPV